MDLSNFVHVKKTRRPLTAVYLSEDQFVPQKYQTQNYPEGCFNDNGFSAQKEQIMAASLMSKPYSQQAQSYAYLQVPQPPPSPPVEEILKRSLPSISNLLGIADDNPTQQQELAQQRSQKTPDDRRHPLQYAPLSTATTPRQSLPLTPPKHGSESRHSPSSSVSSTTQYGSVPTPAAYYFAAGSAINNLDVNLERQSTESPRASVSLSHPQYGLPTSYTMMPPPTMRNYDPTLAGNPQISNRMYYQSQLLNPIQNQNDTLCQL
ncbi:hypothetical protein V501_00773 [Pseudogymnoascus sp. VKM F-4519 (FW-2642)]|nr:hypothetical protein V501_00773 [Pseudogymnoascus sp. VKM F-4519 (FW-2642)]